MELWMTATTGNADFAETFTTARQVIESAFNQRFVVNAYGSGLIELQYRALLHQPRQRVAGEAKRYLKMSHTVKLSARVELPVICHADVMVERLATSLARAVERLRSLPIPNFDTERFSTDYVAFAIDQDWIAPTPLQSPVGRRSRHAPAAQQAPQGQSGQVPGACPAVPCVP